MSLSQPINFRQDEAYLSSLRERWSRAFAELEIIENISKGEKDDRQWLMECGKGLEVLEEIIAIVKEEKRCMLESIRYEFPKGEKYLEEGEVSRMSDLELLEENTQIFEDFGLQFNIQQEDYFYDFV